jgi:hypothetical protein
MTTRATAGLSAGVLIVAALLAACGDDGGDKAGDSDPGAFADQGYDEIKQAALEAMDSLEAMHAELDLESEGQSYSIDLSMSTDGNCTGTVTVGGATTEMLRVDGEGWYKPSRQLLEQIYPGKAAAAAAFVRDSWVVDTEDSITGSDCDLARFIDSLSDDADETNTEVVGVEELDGQQVVKLAYSDAEVEGTVYVLAEGEHYLVRIERAGELPGTATFSEFDEPVDTEPPADVEVVDLASFRS